jgi:hypothetical protein
MAESFSSTTPIGFTNTAEACRVGAQVLARELKGVGGWAGDPARYLYDHCIELSMKAALISTGRNEAHWRWLCHGFINLAKECNAAGLGLKKRDDLNVLARVDAQKNDIKARFHDVGALTVATVQCLDCTAREPAVLAVQTVRRSGVPVRAPRPALTFEDRFQIG